MKNSTVLDYEINLETRSKSTAFSTLKLSAHIEHNIDIGVSFSDLVLCFMVAPSIVLHGCRICRKHMQGGHIAFFLNKINLNFIVHNILKFNNFSSGASWCVIIIIDIIINDYDTHLGDCPVYKIYYSQRVHIALMHSCCPHCPQVTYRLHDNHEWRWCQEWT